MTIRQNALRPSLDIAGTSTKLDSLDLSQEQSSLGVTIAGQIGSNATVASLASGIATITGLTGMTALSVGRFITFTGASNSRNNGTFRVTAFNSSTSVGISNSLAITSDANNGAISWIERQPYTLEDDVNFARTDRAAIKGASYSSSIPTYTRPSAINTSVPANLSNVAGKTTDAKSIVFDRKRTLVSVTNGVDFIQITDAGNLKHATINDRTGVPIHDGEDATQFEATYVRITDSATGLGLEVLSGLDAGKLIYGRTRAGAASSPNSVEIEFRATTGYDLTNSVSYTWELGQPELIDIVYGYRERLDQIEETAFRSRITNTLGIGSSSSGGITENQHRTLRQLIHFISEGPAEGFTSGAYKETLPSADPFPTQIIWWESSLKLKKIVEKTITRNSEQMPVTTAWKIYDIDGVTALHTITDTHSYSGIFEVSRTRIIS